MPNKDLIETLVADLIELSNNIVEKQSELASEYENLRSLVNQIHNKMDSNDKDMRGDGAVAGLQEQVRICVSNINDHNKVIIQAQKHFKEFDKIKNKQTMQWWILGAMGLAILGKIGQLIAAAFIGK